LLILLAIGLSFRRLIDNALGSYFKVVEHLAEPDQR
jgi:hypothetical protein